ncbi:MAG: polysaccharide biosynthesis/export family protein [Roseiarcus sp.]|jgi:polysaccharide export outer membrane protein
MRHGLGAVALSICVAALVGGCSILPAAGPSSEDINSGQTASGPEHVVVKLNPDVVSTVSAYGQPSFVGTFADKRPPADILFGVGDVLTITIFEASAGGLFIPAEAGVRPGNFVTLPNEPIDSAGNISVPYAGPIKAAGRTQGQVQQQIVNALKNRAIDPQVVVALATQNTSLISVLGEVNTPNRFAAFPAGEHLLDAITRAGGIKGQGWDTVVELERDGKRAVAPFASLVYDPRNNIWAHPNDTIYVFREPQTFVAFGAAGQQGQFAFDDWKISLAEAVGKAGGLLDVQADPASVYVYRREPKDLVAKLGVDVSALEGPTVPVIYAVNFRDGGGYFLATKFEMRDKDVMFAANAPSVEMTKFLNFLNTVNTTFYNGVLTASELQTLRLQIAHH